MSWTSKLMCVGSFTPTFIVKINQEIWNVSSGTYLHASFTELEPKSKFFTSEHIGILGLLEGPFELVQLESRKSGPATPHFPRFVFGWVIDPEFAAVVRCVHPDFIHVGVDVARLTESLLLTRQFVCVFVAETTVPAGGGSFGIVAVVAVTAEASVHEGVGVAGVQRRIWARYLVPVASRSVVLSIWFWGVWEN